ncbi:anti-sigma factor [Nakamurella endophytica]|uniref:Anti-sigma K factor RskA C-terminal domain-containing protein n=1 Tax=Nakamurella endophytica TaxID=1748367 RepID=A0A917T5Z5_9ACTN|nr:anti-sigma factor [Nakamurella endophytica]GGM10548.1 hypothetical protein GCM10011594_33060 [Nakamurella endophytica]
MQHPDAADLALLALGIDPDVPGAADTARPGDRDRRAGDESVAQHLVGCDECRTEVAELARAVDLARLEDLGDLVPPPPRVWSAIAAELGLDDQDRAGASPDRPTPVAEPAGTGRAGDALEAGPDRRGDRDRVVAPATAPRRVAGGRPAAGPRRVRQALLSLAAAVVVGVVGALIGYAVRGADGTGQPAPAATAALAAVPGGPGTPAETGVARMFRTSDGMTVTVAATGLPPVNGSYVVWLLGSDGRMVTLGALTDGSGSFAVPHGIDVSQYSTVDISDEPPDGNPAHSGISILRGRLT